MPQSLGLCLVAVQALSDRGGSGFRSCCRSRAAADRGSSCQRRSGERHARDHCRRPLRRGQTAEVGAGHWLPAGGRVRPSGGARVDASIGPDPDSRARRRRRRLVAVVVVVVVAVRLATLVLHLCQALEGAEEEPDYERGSDHEKHRRCKEYREGSHPLKLAEERAAANRRNGR
jgi:hypothetical protein